MSQVKRYRLDPESFAAEHPQGDLVDYQDYARLKADLTDCKAESDRLKAEVERLRKLFADTERLMLLDGEYEAAPVGTYARLDDLCKKLGKQHSDISCENIMLRKAGDALCESPYALETDPAVIEWRAAKEGKQP